MHDPSHDHETDASDDDATWSIKSMNRYHSQLKIQHNTCQIKL